MTTIRNLKNRWQWSMSEWTLISHSEKPCVRVWKDWNNLWNSGTSLCQFFSLLDVHNEYKRYLSVFVRRLEFGNSLGEGPELAKAYLSALIWVFGAQIDSCSALCSSGASWLCRGRLLSAFTFRPCRDKIERTTGQENAVGTVTQLVSTWDTEHMSQNVQYVTTAVPSQGRALCQGSPWVQEQKQHCNRHSPLWTSQQWNMPGSLNPFCWLPGSSFGMVWLVLQECFIKILHKPGPVLCIRCINTVSFPLLFCNCCNCN